MPTVREAKPSSPKVALRNLLVVGAVLLFVIILVLVLRTKILTGLADYLIINDKLQPADMLFLLNGDADTRPFRASQLYQQGLAPLIVIARMENTPPMELGLEPNETDISVGVMEKLAVPPGKIVILPFPGGVTSTFDEAAALRQYVQANQIHRIILVTSAFHTRRARWIFQRSLDGLPVILEVAVVPYPGFDQTTWWKNETGLITLNNEYIKLVYYFFKYH